MTKSKRNLKKAEKVEIIEPEIIKNAIEIKLEEPAPEPIEIKTAPEPKEKPINDSFKDKVMNSSITNRVSPSTLTTIFCASDNKDEIIKAIISQLANSITACSPREFKEITSDLNKLID